MRLIDMLRRIGVDWITSPELTGEMEHRLLQVQRGEVERSAYMNDIVERTTTMVHRIKDHDRSVLYADERTSLLAHRAMSRFARPPWPTSAWPIWVRMKDATSSSGKTPPADGSIETRLLASSNPRPLTTFTDSSAVREEYAASVTLSDAGKVTTKGNGAGSVEITDEPIASCPVCESGTVRQGHDGYACDSDDCTFRGIRAEMCQRPITVEEARAILTDGRSALLEGFISRRGKPFSAYLVLNGKKIDYDFPPRQAAADATKFDVTPGVVAVCPKTNAAIVETRRITNPKKPGADAKFRSRVKSQSAS